MGSERADSASTSSIIKGGVEGGRGHCGKADEEERWQRNGRKDEEWRQKVSVYYCKRSVIRFQIFNSGSFFSTFSDQSLR